MDYWSFIFRKKILNFKHTLLFDYVTPFLAKRSLVSNILDLYLYNKHSPFNMQESLIIAQNEHTTNHLLQNYPPGPLVLDFSEKLSFSMIPSSSTMSLLFTFLVCTFANTHSSAYKSASSSPTMGTLPIISCKDTPSWITCPHFFCKSFCFQKYPHASSPLFTGTRTWFSKIPPWTDSPMDYGVGFSEFFFFGLVIWF